MLANSLLSASRRQSSIALGSRSFAGALATLDKDNDGSLDLAEVKDAAASVFDKLDKDSDATLDRKETGGRIGKEDFRRKPTRIMKQP